MRRALSIIFIFLFASLLSSCGGHEHEYREATVPPSCTYGYTLHTCVCGHSYTDGYRPAVGHSYEARVLSADCHSGTLAEHVCVKCGDSYTKRTEGTVAHDYVEEKMGPTKDRCGYIKSTCTICGDSYDTVTVAALGYSAGLEYEEIRTGVVRVVGIGDCRDAQVVVPRRNEYNEIVLEIGEGAFDGLDITSLTVRYGVQRIAAGAVRDCARLEAITVERGIEVEKNAFVGLSAVRTLVMPCYMEPCFVFAGRVPETLTEYTYYEEGVIK